ncbi:hypothetical protein PAUR_a0952 [Pseudoalteromonas aurantia 208]|uniref:Protease n=2 Tax=Pseudoalteromonas TaxID=53246 RepID=A0ABR9E9B2_9GAMM|nr:hypothetical protein [Pseudoalteromonas aurantia 208]
MMVYRSFIVGLVLLASGCDQNMKNLIGLGSNSSLTCTIKSTKSGDNQYLVTFIFTNTTNEPVRFLKWHTPFEGWWSQFLHVEQSGVELLYQGPMAKRAKPTEHDYIELAAHEHRSITLNLLNAYDVALSSPTTITLSSELSHPDSPNIDCSMILVRQ